MKPRSLHGFAILSLMLGTCAVLTACELKIDTSNIESIAFSQSKYTLVLGDERQLDIQVNYVDDEQSFDNVPFIYTSNNSDRVEFLLNGYMRAIGLGTTLISAEVLGAPQFHATAIVEVISAEDATPLEAIEIDQANANLDIGDTLQLSHTLIPNNGYVSNIVYSSTNAAVASVDESSGLVTAHSDGTTTINVDALTTNNVHKSDSIQVTVEAGEPIVVPLDSVSINGTPLSIKVGQTKNFSYSLNPSNASVNTNTITWNSSDSSIATITNSGQVKGLSVGTATITFQIDGVNDQEILTVSEANDDDNPSYLRETDPYTGTYYDSLDLNTTGASLKNAVRQRITDGHKTNANSYTGLRDVWPHSDKDPDTGKMLWFYTGTERNGFDGASNREHVWPKDGGDAFPAETYAGSDAQHLRPTDSTMNSFRGSLQFGEVPYSTDAICRQGSADYAYGRFPGPEWLCYRDKTYFYPAKGWRGQTARIIMYVEVRWGAQYNLHLVEGAGKSKTIGDFPTLMKWHLEEPPTEFEMVRNDYLFGHQGNRNPFIDHPELACQIYQNDGASYNSKISQTCSLY